MDILTATAGSLMANFLTVSFLYVAWRLNRPGAEHDVKGILMGIGICVAVIVIALAARQQV